MNSKTTIIGLVAAVAVLSGAMGLSVTGAFSDQTIALSVPSNVATGFLMGQVIIEAHNADGELIAYRIGDNVVVDDGEQCILKMLFSATNSSGVGRGDYTSTDDCTGKLVGAWDVIAIGSGQGMCVNVSAHSAGTCALIADHDFLVTMGVELTGSGMDRAYATTKNWTNGTGGNDTQIVLKKTFTQTSGGAITVYESGLFNSTTIAGSGMLSHKTFAGVVLANNDSITVQWTFVVGD